jgi:hypothetical protein
MWGRTSPKLSKDVELRWAREYSSSISATHKSSGSAKAPSISLLVFFGVLENGLLMTLFEPKRKGVTGEWRKFHNEELHNFHSTPDSIRMIRGRGWGGGACNDHVRELHKWFCWENLKEGTTLKI